ncbi:MAG TPA: hypothetical protein VNE62_02300 [Actinomycetota bacterium]|nr:hypothetical protein [Actinomycetota bacterium]
MRVELRLLAKTLPPLAAVAVALAVVGTLAGGRTGAASALAGAGLAAVNLAAAALSTGWARVLRPGVIAFGYAAFVVRMFLMFSALAAATSLPWVHRGLLAAGFCSALAVALGAECVSYVRKSYVPAWRVAR